MGAVARRLNLPLQMVKNHLRVDLSEDDALIQSYIQAALEEADDFLNNEFEDGTERIGSGDGQTTQFSVTNKPIFKMRSVKVGGNLVSTSAYSVVESTGIITFNTAPESGKIIEVEYEADFPIPERVRSWVLSRVANKYENRTQGVMSQSDDAGSVGWTKPDYSGIWQLRKNPGF